MRKNKSIKVEVFNMFGMPTEINGIKGRINANHDFFPDDVIKKSYEKFNKNLHKKTKTIHKTNKIDNLRKQLDKCEYLNNPNQILSDHDWNLAIQQLSKKDKLSISLLTQDGKI